VRAAIRSMEEKYGRVRGIIHGAGLNQPALLRDLHDAALQRTFDPKIAGLRNLLAVVDPAQLRLLVTFGSVIGRVGLRGEADYALANSYLSLLTEDFSLRYPECRCVAFESTAWSGSGMAERLGKVEMLRAMGIGMLPLAEGVSQFGRLISRKLPAPSVVLSGRLGASSPIEIESPPLPVWRFLERTRVHYPGIELVTEADLSIGSDPYLCDHVFNGEPLLPAVMGLEAMVQVAMAAAGKERIPSLEDIRFERPVVVRAGNPVTVRIAALAREDGRVEVALRSSQTFFQVDHFRCRCSFEDRFLPARKIPRMPEESILPLNPHTDLYGALLFQGPRFQRLTGYRKLNAGFSWADIAPGESGPWFAQYLPGALLLGSPDTRDAAIHSIQACVPDAVLLPAAVERLWAAPLKPGQRIVAHASERWHEGKTYCYDLALRSVDGTLCEYWEGLRLQKIAAIDPQAWPEPLVATFLEWRAREASPKSRVFAAFARDRKASRRKRTEQALGAALETYSPVRWREDGKPMLEDGLGVSAAHSDGLTLVVAGDSPIACDIEPVSVRPEKVWRDLLGDEGWSLARAIAEQTNESIDAAATRVWTAIESLVKAGIPKSATVMLSSSSDTRNSVWLTVGSSRISSSLVRFSDDPKPIVISVLTGAIDAHV
jgi:enediyne polyketide synthase